MIPFWQGVSVDDSRLHPTLTAARTSAQMQSWSSWLGVDELLSRWKRKKCQSIVQRREELTGEKDIKKI